MDDLPDVSRIETRRSELDVPGASAIVPFPTPSSVERRALDEPARHDAPVAW
ncbi:hypothetical protein AKJ08_3108 [Vulgatibacter incomptus]|uniref:Uncharacterized protein n=1 Tax=Vulgatibacter incomptus TaxID=1391653 RepID=A0A0K1PH47_9BACT|nr:hypothetical protein AKJ08_3108 [Vulgatibacter incomptus]